MCDALAKDFGELEPEPVSCEVRDVADRAVGSAGGGVLRAAEEVTAWSRFV